jgi:hypothetical protein
MPRPSIASSTAASKASIRFMPVFHSRGSFFSRTWALRFVRLLAQKKQNHAQNDDRCGKAKTGDKQPVQPRLLDSQHDETKENQKGALITRIPTPMNGSSFRTAGGSTPADTNRSTSFLDDNKKPTAPIAIRISNDCWCLTLTIGTSCVCGCAWNAYPVAQGPFALACCTGANKQIFQFGG